MFTLVDNRSPKDYHPQVKDLVVGEFFEFDEQIFLKTYEGSPKNFVCYNFTKKEIAYFYGGEEVDCVLQNVTIIVENN